MRTLPYIIGAVFLASPAQADPILHPSQHPSRTALNFSDDKKICTQMDEVEYRFAKELDRLSYYGEVIVTSGLQRLPEYPNGASDLEKYLMDFAPKTFLPWRSFFNAWENQKELRRKVYELEGKPGAYFFVSTDGLERLPWPSSNEQYSQFMPSLREICMDVIKGQSEDFIPSTRMAVLYVGTRPEIKNYCPNFFDPESSPLYVDMAEAGERWELRNFLSQTAIVEGKFKDLYTRGCE